MAASAATVRRNARRYPGSLLGNTYSLLRWAGGGHNLVQGFGLSWERENGHRDCHIS